jgi:hypothetical protein
MDYSFCSFFFSSYFCLFSQHAFAFLFFLSKL